MGSSSRVAFSDDSSSSFDKVVQRPARKAHGGMRQTWNRLMRRPDGLPDELSRETDFRCLVVLASAAAIGYAVDDTLGLDAQSVPALSRWGWGRSLISA